MRTSPLRLVELFAGTRSVGRAAEERGWEVWSTDLYPFEGLHAQADILDLDPATVPWTPDAIWASPPCTYFSVASIGHHWSPNVPTDEYPTPHTPKTKEALLGVRIVEATLAFIAYWQLRNPDLVWYMENPCGKLRKLPVVANLPRRVGVTYCAYGDTRRKPTDLWTNDTAWVPRPMCKNGDPCHTPAPRGSKTPGSTQGHRTVDRSRIPVALCDEVLESAEDWARAHGVPACTDCGRPMAANDEQPAPFCPTCDHDSEGAADVPCTFPCDWAREAGARLDTVITDDEDKVWYPTDEIPSCGECGHVMKDYEDGDGYCCPRCGTDDGSGTYDVLVANGLPVHPADARDTAEEWDV